MRTSEGTGKRNRGTSKTRTINSQTTPSASNEKVAMAIWRHVEFAEPIMRRSVARLFLRKFLVFELHNWQTQAFLAYQGYAGAVDRRLLHAPLAQDGDSSRRCDRLGISPHQYCV